MAIGVTNRDGGKTDEAGHMRFGQAAFTGNIVSGLQVIQRAAGANMSVDITSGDGKISSGTGFWYGIFNDTSGGTGANVTITTAPSGGNSRKDIIVAYIDLSQARSTGVSNNTNGVLKIIAVAGTAGGSPSDPSDSAIQTAVGASNPWTKLGRVTVTSGASSITTSMLTDLRTMVNPVTNGLALSYANLTNPYKFSAMKTASQTSLANASKVNYETEEFDTGSNYDNATNYRFVAPVAGFYEFHAQAYVESATGLCRIAFHKNGTLYKYGSGVGNNGNSDTIVQADALMSLSATDYIEVYFYSTAGAKNVHGVTNVGNYSFFQGRLASV